MASTGSPRVGSRYKFEFQDITKTNGQLLTIHHTVTEKGQRKRIQFVRCDFNTTGDSFVAVDHRGTVFLFNVARQFYSVLPVSVARCSCIKFHPCPQNKDLLLATKDGALLLLEYNVETTSASPDVDAFGWSTPTTEGIRDPEPEQLSFGTQTTTTKTTAATVSAKIKLKTRPYPRGNSIINLSFPTSATSNATNPIVSPKATSTLLSVPKSAAPNFPSPSTASSPSNAFLSMTKTQCIVHDLQTFDELFHIDTLDCLSVKHVMYLPPFDYVLLGICGDNTLRVWGMGIPSAEASPSRDPGNNEGEDKEHKFQRRFEVITMRDQFLQRRRAQPVTMNLKRVSSSENVIESLKKDYSEGYLTSVACSRDTRRVIVATLDSTLVVLATNDGDFSVERVLRLANEVYVTKIDFLFSELPDAGIIICRTNIGDLLLLDLMAALSVVKKQPNGESADGPPTTQSPPFLVVEGSCVDFAYAGNYKLFAAQRGMGEIDWFSLEYILRKMETEWDKRKAVMLTDRRSKEGPKIPANDVETVQRQIHSLLSTKRLIAILNEYDEYPQRQIVWRSLLKLPHNETAFYALLHKGDHPCVNTYDTQFPLKSRAALRNLKKIVSCLAYWSPAFAASDFVPHFVFPFLKVHEKNLLFTFEVCATVLLNHGQLLFEFAPLEPFNYLGMIENLLAHFDPKLMEFYMQKKITSKSFAWSLVRTAFAEVLDTEQWLQLWDHLVTNAPEFLVFVAVAYNMTQRPVIMRLERGEVDRFFRDQNLIDMKLFLRTAYSLATQCPAALKPQQYIRPFEPLISPVYQKFYNYPSKAVDKSVAERQRMAEERDKLQAKMEQVSAEEQRMLNQLDRHLADEEHSKRLAEVERALDGLRVHEALETANKHHMVVLCEREQRNKELAVAADLNQCLSRKRTQKREQELEALLRDLDKDRIGEQMELQLSEERRQMMDVESRVKKQLVACANKSSTSSDRQPEKQTKLIKYSDRFRRS